VFFFRFLSWLPFWVLYRISDVLFVLTYFVLGYRRSVVRSNLRLSFPEKPESEISRIEKEFYRHLCDVVVETIKLISISPESLRKRIRHENPDFADDIISSGNSYIAMATHMANWEWLLAGNAIYLDGKIDAVYKPLHNAFFDRLMLRIRTRFGCHPVPSETVLRSQVSRKNIPKGIAMAADQTPGPVNSAIIDFLGRKTLFFKGPAKLAERLNFPLHYAGIRKESRGHYVLFTEPMPDPAELGVEAVLQDFACRLERDIRRQPALWLWSHKRWKHAVPDGPLKN
jgi:KDO2-lipid IV(A) lauroyltransferase